MTQGTTADSIRPRLLTVDQVAVELQIGRNKAYALISSGTIPSLRVGRSIRVSNEALSAWIRAGGSRQ